MPDHRAQITGDFAKLCDIVAKRRAPGGCPWDREQNNQLLLPALIEEAYEAAEAARAQDDAHFCEELGDLLLLVVKHAQIARETALQSATDKFVARFNRLEDQLKMRGRKLGEVELAEMDAIWDEIKNQE